jgi:hypothetical protein
MVGDELTDEERRLFGAYDAAAQLAECCGKLRVSDVPRSKEPLILVMNYLMTELWDWCFTQTEIRTAFMAALDDMNRYAAGEEQRP